MDPQCDNFNLNQRLFIDCLLNQFFEFTLVDYSSFKVGGSIRVVKKHLSLPLQEKDIQIILYYKLAQLY